MSYSADSTDADLDDYRRCARRLRAIHADKPERLQPALSELAHAMDTRNSPHRGPKDFGNLDASATEFAEHVASRVTGDTLRYSDRLALLEVADELKIGRFEANLIIAMVQHRTRGGEISFTRTDDTPRYKVLGLPREIVAFLAVQTAILLGAWFLFS